MTSGEAKKVHMNDNDILTLLRRYDPTTILILLREIYQFPDKKKDWNELVKRTETGITNAREYQMLWRHLAYRDLLMENIEDGAQPLDDDSDHEIELVSVPAVSSEELHDIGACAKEFLSRGLPHEPGQKNPREAPSTIKANKEKMLCPPPDKQLVSQANHGTDVIVPSPQKHLPKGTSTQGLDGNAPSSSSFPPKKKRKLWTIEEDMALIAAAHKFGERNWVDILKKESFQFDRTPSQLAQRWSTLKKKFGPNLRTNYGIKAPSSIQSKERMVATQKAISLALDTPRAGRISGGTQSISTANSSVPPFAISEPLPASSQALNQLKQLCTLPISQAMTLNTSDKSGIQKSMEDAVLCAGGRRAEPSDAAAFIKATQSKNAVHIRPVGGAQPSSNPIKILAPTNIASKSAVVTSAWTQANPSSSSSGMRHGGHKIHCSLIPSSNPPSTPSTTQQTFLEPMLKTKVDNDTSATDANELMVEEVNSADERDLNDAVDFE